MAPLQTTCTNCGSDVGLHAGEVLAAWDARSGGDYAFVCPACRVLSVKQADAPALRLLRLVGVDVLDVTRPPHPEAPPAGPALTLDDLIDLHQALADPRVVDHICLASARSRKGA